MDSIHKTNGYVKGNVELAITYLVGAGSIQQRLKDAIQPLHKLRLDRDNDFAEDIKPEWELIYEQLSKVDTLSDEDAGQLAVRIFDVYKKL